MSSESELAEEGVIWAVPSEGNHVNKFWMGGVDWIYESKWKEHSLCISVHVLHMCSPHTALFWFSTATAFASLFVIPGTDKDFPGFSQNHNFVQKSRLGIRKRVTVSPLEVIEEGLSYSGIEIGPKLSVARPPGKRRGQISKNLIGQCPYLS